MGFSHEQIGSNTLTEILQKNVFNVLKVAQPNNRDEKELYLLEFNVFMGTGTKSKNNILDDEKIPRHITAIDNNRNISTILNRV